MAATPPPSEVDPRVALQAAEWLVRLQTEGSTPANQAELLRWRSLDPRHEMAWQRAERVLGKLSASRSGVDTGTDNRLGALSAAALRESSRSQRRMATKLLATAIVAGPVGYASWRLAPWNEWSADIRTATGERRELLLPDGSKIQLDTGSALDLAFSSSERRLILRAGAISIQTAADSAQRPFLVQTREGTARALGTRYTVRMEPKFNGAVPSSLIAVQQGAVELSPAKAGKVVRLEAGSQTRMRAEHVDPPEPADLASDGWTHGVLYADKTPLSIFTAELSRYRLGILRCDPAIAALPVSGAFQLRNTDEALMALAASLPVRILQRTRYWVSIGPR
ncbi:MAG: FecR domain-containing protein [Comamonas sp.]